MPADTPRRGLGRGLSALMSDLGPIDGQSAPAPDRTVPVERLVRNPDQPRRRFVPEDMAELTDSIRRHGVLQPILVRPLGDQYQIVAGERRWRAAQAAELHEVPVLVREMDDGQTLEVAIVENVQRADLDPIEEAAGYRQLIDRFGHTQEEIGRHLGKSRSHIANTLRLLQLPPEVQAYVTDGTLTAGHARALVTSPDPIGMASRIMNEGLNVRQTEALAKGLPPDGAKPTRPEKDADTRALEADLSAALGMPVQIEHRGKGGRLVLRYPHLEALDMIVARLGMR